ncbi:MAG TPA: 3-hydroxyacyl-CoA dehydrogenase NAD-binding domain-containing protein [Puia sp.]|nr:3-hydroxyacyl-CoA dehydrogenase NAD-binding domain-containing protein [Puia sp.]
MAGIICVCGAGTMGSGIAQAAAQAGFRAILYDVNETIILKAQSTIKRSIQALVEKNKIDQSLASATLSRLAFTTDISNCIADIIIEAIIEKKESKTELFTRLARINSAETILATNTSSLSVSAIAENIIHPERIIGMHFFNPPVLMKLVEVVSTNYTNKKTIIRIGKLALQLGKTPVFCKDSPGFIVNHVARPFYIEALRLVELGLADFETIDHLMENCGFNMGPFKLMDLIGNDINYTVSCSVYEAMNKPQRLRPSFIQEEKVRKNELGKKTGKGYYTYS